MKDDTISRQAAIDALADYIHNVDRVYSTGKLTHDDCMDAAHSVLDELPSAQQWIPCSERLPEDEEEVIVSVRDDSGDNTLNYSSSGWYACAGDFWVVDNEANERVVAWMPLPAPYIPEGDDKHEG